MRDDVAAAGGRSAGGLVVLDCAYSLEHIRKRGLEHVVTQLDLDGFFDHVWYVQPLLGADAATAQDALPGPARSTPVTPRHTVLEAPVGRLGLLRRASFANLILAQALLFVRLSRLLRRQRVSALAVADPFYLGLWGLALSRIHRIPFVVKINANYDSIYEATGGVPLYPRLLRWRRLESLISRMVLTRADLVTVGSDDNLRYVTSVGTARERVGMIPTGDMIAAVHLRAPRERESVAEELGLAGRPFVVFVGRLEPSKHPDAALLVLAALRRSVPEAALVVVGDGSMRRDLEERSRELGICDDVRFVGIRDQGWIARALTSASVIVCPYSGLVLVEGAMSGTPIVGYDVEWHAEFISSGENGVLVPYGDSDALAAAVEALLRDPERAAAIAETARARALRDMDRDDAVAVKRSAYAAVCARGRA